MRIGGKISHEQYVMNFKTIIFLNAFQPVMPKVLCKFGHTWQTGQKGDGEWSLSFHTKYTLIGCMCLGRSGMIQQMCFSLLPVCLFKADLFNSFFAPSPPPPQHSRLPRNTGCRSRASYFWQAREGSTFAAFLLIYLLH